MSFTRFIERARVNAPTFVLTVVVASLAVGAVSAQSTTSEPARGQSVFRDAKLLDARENADDAKSAPRESKVVAPSYEAPRAENPYDKIRLTSATEKKTGVEPLQKTRANNLVAQTQYAEAKTDSAVSQNLSLFDANAPYVDKCPDPSEMPSILDAPYKLVPSPGKMPPNCPLPDEEFTRKPPTPITFTWKASNLCYKPLYFEDVQLERYGHYRSPWLQPAISRVKFWLTIPCLPYLMGVNPPNECIYDLGYYRPGNCAPSMLEPIPISLRGGLLEAGAIVGAAAALP